MDAAWTKPFFNQVKATLLEMANIVVNKEEPLQEGINEMQLSGITSIVSFAGESSGRFVLDVEYKLACEIAGNLIGRNETGANPRLFMEIVSELNNTIAGNALSQINNQMKLGLRLEPPVVISGLSTTLWLQGIESATVYFHTD
jgi:chemotaxis protein CheX